MTTQNIVRILDWFLLEGGDPGYDPPIDSDGEVGLSEEIHEIRFPDFEVYVGPSISGPATDFDVAVLLRPAIAVDREVAESIYRPHVREGFADLSLEFRDTDDGRDDTSVWLVLRLESTRVENGDHDLSLTELMRTARRILRETT